MNCPKANPSVKSAKVLCTLSSDTFSSWAMVGNEDKYISIAKGVSIDSIPKMMINSAFVLGSDVIFV